MHIQSIYTNYNYYCTELTIDVMSQISYTLIHHQHHDTTKSNPFFYLFQRLKQLNLSFKAIKWKWHLYVSVIPSHTGIPLLTPTSFIRKKHLLERALAWKYYHICSKLRFMYNSAAKKTVHQELPT